MFCVQIFLFIFRKQKEQVDVAPAFKMQKHTSKSASLALASAWIRYARLANPSQSSHQVAAIWILEQVPLNIGQHRICHAGC